MPSTFSNPSKTGAGSLGCVKSGTPSLPIATNTNNTSASAPKFRVCTPQTFLGKLVAETTTSKMHTHTLSTGSFAIDGHNNTAINHACFIRESILCTYEVGEDTYCPIGTAGSSRNFVRTFCCIAGFSSFDAVLLVVENASPSRDICSRRRALVLIIIILLVVAKDDEDEGNAASAVLFVRSFAPPFVAGFAAVAPALKRPLIVVVVVVVKVALWVMCRVDSFLFFVKKNRKVSESEEVRGIMIDARVVSLVTHTHTHTSELRERYS